MTDGLIFCVDWGTTSFRLKLVQESTLEIIAETSNNKGGIGQLQHATGVPNRDKKGISPVLMGFLQDAIHEISDKMSGIDLAGVPIVLSGMVSSNIGLVELPYTMLPISYGGEGIRTQVLCPEYFDHILYVISGLRTADDVMRGEETQVIGLLQLIEDKRKLEEAIVILPGTHSKHVYLKGGTIERFDTHITGEMLSLLLDHSVLRFSAKKPVELSDVGWQSFAQGLKEAQRFSLFNSFFHIRTNQLLGVYDQYDNYMFLCGILLGHELLQLDVSENTTIVLAAGHAVYPFYRRALELLFTDQELVFIDPLDLEKATVLGQVMIMKTHQKNNIAS